MIYNESMKNIDEYKLFIWDFNGTIVDDLEAGLEVQRIMLKERELEPLSKQRYLATFSFPIRDWYRYLGYDIEKYPGIAKQWSELYLEEAKNAPLCPGVERLLKGAFGEGIRQMILSAGHMEMLLPELERLGVRNFFEKVYALDNHYADTKRTLALKLKGESGESPEKMLIIGDTTEDLEMARLIGCDCALIAFGHQSIERLKREHDNVFADCNGLYNKLFMR